MGNRAVALLLLLLLLLIPLLLVLLRLSAARRRSTHALLEGSWGGRELRARTTRTRQRLSTESRPTSATSGSKRIDIHILPVPY